MTEKKMDIFEKQYIGETAKELLSCALTELTKTTQTQIGETPRLFFPHGIELISITVNVLSKVVVEFKVAGAEGISGLLNSEEFESEQTEKVSAEVIE